MKRAKSQLARRHGADLTCPLMSGIFFSLIAGATEDSLSVGEAPVAPYWRVVLDDGTLSPKTPDGAERQAVHLRREGHGVEPKGARLRVAGFREHAVA